MEDLLIVGNCPDCGSPVVKTCKDYRCRNAVGQEPACQFSVYPIVCNRKLSEVEVSALLNGETLLLDGMATNEGKAFTSTVHMDKDGKLIVDAKVSVCPKCGGTIYAGAKAFSCGNRKGETACTFVLWRTYGGYVLTLKDVKDICEKGVTADELTMYHDDGTIYKKRLALTPEKDKVVRI